MPAEFSQCLTTVAAELIEQVPARAVGEGFEDPVSFHPVDRMQVITCMST